MLPAAAADKTERTYPFAPRSEVRTMTARMRTVIALVSATLASTALCSLGFSADPPPAPGEAGGYRVTTRTERKPVTDVRYEERRSTVYREEVSTQTRDIQRVVQIPVTEYQWEPYWVNRWNPFATAYI